MINLFNIYEEACNFVKEMRKEGHNAQINTIYTRDREGMLVSRKYEVWVR